MVNATTTANREMYAITAIKSIQTIMANAVNTVFMDITVIKAITSHSSHNCNYVITTFVDNLQMLQPSGVIAICH